MNPIITNDHRFDCQCVRCMPGVCCPWQQQGWHKPISAAVTTLCRDYHTGVPKGCSRYIGATVLATP